MTTKDKEEKEEVILQDDRLNNIPVITTTLKDKTPTPNDWIEKIAMNIVYQLDDDAKLSVEFRQANNDKRIDFVKGLIQSSITQQKEAIEKDYSDKINKLLELLK